MNFPQSPETEARFHALWEVCEAFYGNVLSQPLTKIDASSLARVGRLIYDFVSALGAKPELFYTNHIDLLTRHLAPIVEGLRFLIDPNNFLKTYLRHWDLWLLSNKRINATAVHFVSFSPFSHPQNQTWVGEQRKTKEFGSDVYPLGILAEFLWREHLVIPLQTKLKTALLHLIEQDRQGTIVDRDVIRAVLLSFVRLGINYANFKEPLLTTYHKLFEEEFLEVSRTFYIIESSAFLAQNSVLDYLRYVEKRFKEEEIRLDCSKGGFLPSSTGPELLAMLTSVMAEGKTSILEAEFQIALEQEKVETLTSLYFLMSKVNNGTEALKISFQEHIERNCEKSMNALFEQASEKADPKAFVQLLVTSFRKFNSIVKQHFSNDMGFLGALDRAYVIVLNKNPFNDPSTASKRGAVSGNSARLLASYCDLILRKGPHQIKDEKEMDETLSDVLSLFKYLSAKDVFLALYAKLLARRLLTGTSASEDAEQSMTQKLKSLQGMDSCHKLIRMLADIQISRDNDKSFQTFLVETNTRLKFGLSVNVVAHGCWPLQAPNTDFLLPKTFQEPRDLFWTFYDSKYAGRKLTLLHDHSRAEVDDRTTKGRLYKLTTNTYQAAILLQFNEEEFTSIPLVQEAFKLPDDIATNAFYGLVKSGVLVSDPPTDDPDSWSKETKFLVNLRRRKTKTAKLSCVSWNRTKVKSEVVEDKEIESHRHLVIRSWIVRLMKAQSSKAEKRMTHNDLIAQVSQATMRWFVVQPAAIKKAIESLLDFDPPYMRRAQIVDEKSGSSLPAYEYVA